MWRKQSYIHLQVDIFPRLLISAIGKHGIIQSYKTCKICQQHKKYVTIIIPESGTQGEYCIS